ncbi:hypothetical protein Tco_0103167 [Tanacetum coccineum]
MEHLCVIWYDPRCLHPEEAFLTGESKPRSFSQNSIPKEPVHGFGYTPLFAKVVKGKEVQEYHDDPVMVRERGSLNYEGDPVLVGIHKWEEENDDEVIPYSFQSIVNEYNIMENSPNHVENSPGQMHNSPNQMENFNVHVENSHKQLENSPDHVENFTIHIENSTEQMKNSPNHVENSYVHVENSHGY